MKRRIALLTLAVAMALPMNAFAMEVPTETVVQNLNGSQQVVKTYTIAPEDDPQKLVEEPFELEGYLYTFADIVKVENHVEDSKRQTETVTVETSKNDLSAILDQLAPTMEYDDGLYSGTLSLDHTSLHTEAAGYTSRSSTLSETKTIGPLDRNDMSYVPATTVKNGVTLSLSNVDWQVIGTDLVGDVLAPSSYQAVATYTGKSYYSAATGYPHGFGGNLTVFTGASEESAAKTAVDNWVNSPDHFRSMIDSRGDCVGVGVERYEGVTYCYLFVGMPGTHNPYE